MEGPKGNETIEQPDGLTSGPTNLEISVSQNDETENLQLNMNALFLVSAGARLKVAEFLFEKWWRKQEKNEREQKTQQKGENAVGRR